MNIPKSKRFDKIEPYFFFLMLIIGLVPLLFSRYFVTLDGPSHLYNANLIKELFLDKNPEISNLFTINDFPVPNWSGHFIMAMLNLILPAYLSEKILLLVYFILTPLFFRKFLLHFYPENRLITYFILLFVHNHILYFGFFNMSLGITFLFVTGHYFVTYCDNLKFHKVLLLTSLFLIIYFSHVFIFLISLFIMTSTVLLKSQGVKTGDSLKITNTDELKDRLIVLLIAALPGIILSFAYFTAIDSVEKGIRPDLSKLLQWIVDIRPLLTLCYCDSWISFSHILLATFALLILSNLYLLIKDSFAVKDGQIHIQQPIKLSWLWFIISFIFLFLFLILPNAILFTERLILLFYLFFIGWLVSLKYPRAMKIVSLAITVFVHLVFVQKHFVAMKTLTKDAKKVVSAADIIDSNSIVLTFNYSDNWLHSHITGYLGADKPIAVLENYEAGLKWFPVRWDTTVYQIDRLNTCCAVNKNMATDFYINKEDTTGFSLKKMDGSIKKIPYVFVMGNFIDENDVNTIKIESTLNSFYQEIQSYNLCKLYKLVSD